MQILLSEVQTFVCFVFDICNLLFPIQCFDNNNFQVWVLIHRLQCVTGHCVVIHSLLPVYRFYSTLALISNNLLNTGENSTEYNL